MITCASTHCERRQECSSPHDCTGSAKRTQSPCEHCGEGDTHGIRDEYAGAIVNCYGCGAYMGLFYDDGHQQA